MGEWGDGTWWIGNEASGVLKVMDVSGENRRQVVLREKDEGAETQRWRIEAIREISEDEFYDRPATPGEGEGCV